MNLQGRWQAAYTAGIVLPKPVGRCRYWHRSLNPKKLIEVRCCCLPLHVCIPSQSPSVSLHACPSVRLSACLSVYLSVCLFICLSDCLSVCLFVCLSADRVSLSVCLNCFAVCRLATLFYLCQSNKNHVLFLLRQFVGCSLWFWFVDVVDIFS